MAVHLPRDSATMLAVAPRSESELWGIEGYLLALAIDLLAGANWQRSGRRGGKPKPLKRPKDPTRIAGRPDRQSIADFRSWYAAQPGGRSLAS